MFAIPARWHMDGVISRKAKPIATVLSVWVVIATALTHAVSAEAAEIKGTVREGNAQKAIVTVEGDLVPRPGDKAEIFFRLPDVGEEISVGTGKVNKVDGDSIELQIENATGDVAKDQLVRITSANPAKRTPSSSGSAATQNISLPGRWTATAPE